MSLAPDRRLSHSVERPRDLSRPLPSALSWTVLLAFTAAFAIAFAALELPWWIPALYVAMSLITFTAYALDKSAARRSAQRISEQALLSLGILGGWPGAILAQRQFRHKTRKLPFLIAFWAVVVQMSTTRP